MNQVFCLFGIYNLIFPSNSVEWHLSSFNALENEKSRLKNQRYLVTYQSKLQEFEEYLRNHFSRLSNCKSIYNYNQYLKMEVDRWISQLKSCKYL